MTIIVERFWTHYKPGADGSTIPVDMVAYRGLGQQHGTNICSVSRLSKVRPLSVAPDNPAVIMANMRWDAIRPQYEAWKAGREAPIEGTPLGAWPGIGQDQAEGLRLVGIRTVEEFAEASDGVIIKIPFGGARALQQQAKTYLASRDRTAVAAKVSQMEQENEVLKEQLAEMAAIVRRLAAERDADDDEQQPRRRGRPPKVRNEAPEPEASAA